ncbi:MAG: hypothetical protein ACREEE_11880 [Dongiaceae bacterium]
MAQIAAMGATKFVIAILCLSVLAAPSMARAEDSPSRGLELRYLAYLYGVTEYCGLNGFEVQDGYRRETRQIIRRENLSENVWRWIRIHGAIDADLEYGDRGLGGYRNWCRTEGVEAATRFLAFRAAQLADEAGATQ